MNDDHRIICFAAIESSVESDTGSQGRLTVTVYSSCEPRGVPSASNWCSVVPLTPCSDLEYASSGILACLSCLSQSLERSSYGRFQNMTSFWLLMAIVSSIVPYPIDSATFNVSTALKLGYLCPTRSQRYFWLTYDDVIVPSSALQVMDNSRHILLDSGKMSELSASESISSSPSIINFCLLK